MIYISKLIMKFPTYSTIQKPICRHFLELTMIGFADAQRLEKFIGVHFKRWQVKVTLWLWAIKVFWVSNGMLEGNICDEDYQRKLKEVNTIFVRCALGVVVDRLVDVYMHIKDKKKLWEELNDKVGASTTTEWTCCPGR